MRYKLFLKAFSLLMALLLFVLALPLNAFAEEVRNSNINNETYIKSIKLTEGLSRDAAKKELQNAGYTFLDYNLNEGTTVLIFQ